jgi:hypothetical protein
MQTTTQPYTDSDNFTTYKFLQSNRTEIDPNKSADLSQSEIWSNYPMQTSADISVDKIGNTLVVKQLQADMVTKTTPETTSSKKSEMPGVVLSIEDVSVVCELYLDDSQERTMHIRLPRNLFPEKVRYGSPITVAYHKDNRGIRRPSVTLRKFEMTECMPQENDEIDALANKF